MTSCQDPTLRSHHVGLARSSLSMTMNRARTLALVAAVAVGATAACAPPSSPLSVTKVIDGDTVEVSTGERVRIIGIDTPESGQCGFNEAANAMRLLVQGKAVTLSSGARDDRDGYGRLLRYVDVGTVDAGLAMIQRGLAVARYDSRDGYGAHQREHVYVTTDAATPNLCPIPGPAGGTSSAPGLDPRFGTCREAIAHHYGPYVRGVDPEYAWYHDADADGRVCE
jgi:endonuclease YncB( thermonuclease family)